MQFCQEKGVAVCFLYGFVASEHEDIACRIAEEFPEVLLSAAHRVAPDLREFEPLSRAVVNAYLIATARSSLPSA